MRVESLSNWIKKSLPIALDYRKNRAGNKRKSSIINTYPPFPNEMVLFGPAGIPLSCKGRTLKDGIRLIRDLELDAIEIQLLRGVEIKEDVAEIRGLAKDLDIRLSIHAPYYTSLVSSNQALAKRSMNNILATGLLADELGANVVVAHPGFYEGVERVDEALKIATSNVVRLKMLWDERGVKAAIGLELSGKRNVFGTLDEIITVCKKVEGVVPVINFAHLHARTGGSLRAKDDFGAVLGRVENELPIKEFYTHFTGVYYEDEDELYHVPIKKGDLRFEPLAECILEKGYDVTVISESPILEHDAVYMRILTERVARAKGIND